MEENEAVNWSLQLFEHNKIDTSTRFEDQRNALVMVIIDLLHHDFNKLLNILYRIDVDENKLKQALFESTQPAAETIADLIIERQLQKIKFRKMYQNKKND